MYIKIKNPARHALLMQLGTSSFLLAMAIVLMIGIFGPIIFSGSITAAKEQAVEFLNFVKQEEGLVVSGLLILGILAIPVGVIVGLIEWWRKRAQWNTPSTVYALDFGTEGITIYTRQNTQFLLYKETDFKMTGELVTVHTRYGSHAALHALTFVFLSQGHSISVSHKLSTIELLCQLADLHTRFKTFEFDCKQSTSHDIDQQELATFLKEQVQNQMRYGLHLRYRNYFVLILYGLLFVVLGVSALWLAFAFGLNPFKDFIVWIPLLPGAIFLTAGIIFLYSAIKEKHTARKLKQLRGN